MSGFITIERDLWEHGFFKNGPMTEREAWVWMIARAAWKATKHRVGSVTVDVPRGTFVTTLRELQKAFQWKSDKRVRTFLSALEGESMIGRTKVGPANAPKTHVTIRNYDDYQQSGRTKDAARTHQRRSADAVKEQGNNKQSNPNGLQPEGVSDQVWSDFVQHRKRKRANITETAMRGICSQAEQAGWPIEDALAETVQRGWTGFKAEWVERREKPKSERTGQSPGEWLKFCEDRVRAARRSGNSDQIQHWENAERQARAKVIPQLRAVQ